ncbi:hypothetical protein L21SP5_01420 [Salinivirga cyanobacteriivorans]|uniref:Uncharacterized protein n=1 Tax=Salinivirga cyanobacteriivorans TaxID=1307839 RepID=A0A0S2HYD0_9BACT|nr:hypothetical protein [Salinivirga cyanobacteriivorans]ALO15070.1 hypothetical protein L21SP5_01420 [Salinivirga cyanobacteriivorans]
MLKRLLLILMVLLSLEGITQRATSASVDDTLFDYFKRLRTIQNIDKKLALNDSIREIFGRILKEKDSFEHGFDTIKTIGKILSPDEKFRLINWNIIKPDGTYNYYCYVQFYNEDKDEIRLTELHDASDSISDPEQQVLMADQWYGALYYEIVPAKVKRRNHYLLLGWDGGDLFVNRKVIDVLSFSSSGVPRFGKSVFKFKKDRKKRVVFEFSYMATMRLFYDDDIDMVVFEHMTPIKPSLKGQKVAYGSDLTFDGLEFEDGKWILRENLDVKNSKKQLNKRKKDISYTF